jgi:hypothetical protein
MQSTCRTVIDEQYLSDPAHCVRWQHTIDFIRRSSFSCTVTSPGLDLGDRTPFTATLEQLFNCSFESTAADLDLASLDGSFGVITAFEVLEHLYNPLHALVEVKRLLIGNSARLYVSMPLRKPLCLASPDHFHEMSRQSALSLFTRAGFKVIRSEEFRIRPLLFYLTGLKPLMRAVFEKVQIYELTA